MSKLYASMKADASKTIATKRAHRYASAHIRGWGYGIEVEVHEVNGKHVYEVWETSGSNGTAARELVYSREVEI